MKYHHKKLFSLLNKCFFHYFIDKSKIMSYNIEKPKNYFNRQGGKDDGKEALQIKDQQENMRRLRWHCRVFQHGR